VYLGWKFIKIIFYLESFLNGECNEKISTILQKQQHAKLILSIDMTFILVYMYKYKLKDVKLKKYIYIFVFFFP